ncbi:hypothetical protein [Acinetobacter sp. c3-l95]|uniref:hypothetical protein n=1 Tax=Acinetobacter sp. c3-l95 TaxID=3342804 RepID=UPI0035B72E51
MDTRLSKQKIKIPITYKIFSQENKYAYSINDSNVLIYFSPKNGGTHIKINEKPILSKDIPHFHILFLGKIYQQDFIDYDCNVWSIQININDIFNLHLTLEIKI